MRIPSLFYREQCTREQAEADAATLDNVRDRNQRAADAWRALADRQDRSDAAHEARLNAAKPTSLLIEANENPDRDFASA